jgi:hypothetical protein
MFKTTDILHQNLAFIENDQANLASYMQNLMNRKKIHVDPSPESKLYESSQTLSGSKCNNNQLEMMP